MAKSVAEALPARKARARPPPSARWSVTDSFHTGSSVFLPTPHPSLAHTLHALVRISASRPAGQRS